VGASIDDFFSQGEVIVQSVQIFRRIKQVTGVTKPNLRNRRTCGQHRIDRWPHIGDIVESIKNTEDIDPCVARFVNESIRNLRGVGRVPDGVSSTQKHLKSDVGNASTQRGKSLPGVLSQKPQRDIVGCPAPRFEGEQLRREMGHRGQYIDQVFGPHPRCEQRLVRIPKSSIGDSEGLLSTQSSRKGNGSEPVQELLGTLRGGGVGNLGKLYSGIAHTPAVAVGLIDGDIAQPGDEFCSPVFAGL